MTKQTVKIECRSCGGAGLYSGMCEGRGEAVVCLGCRGTGAENLTYTPYTGRRRKHGIRSIRFSRGSTLLSCGGTGKSMTYSEFEGQIPAPQI